MTNKIEICKYTPADRPELWRLLRELHSTYFFQTASPQIQELQLEKDLERSYKSYLDAIDENKDGNWLALLAKKGASHVAGFIIGRIETDDDLVLSKFGKFEDWFVEQQFRRQGIGMRLYGELEKWFIATGCTQVHSDTWQGNELSIKAHQQLGFFITGVSFSKKL